MVYSIYTTYLWWNEDYWGWFMIALPILFSQHDFPIFPFLTTLFMWIIKRFWRFPSRRAWASWQCLGPAHRWWPTVTWWFVSRGFTNKDGNITGIFHGNISRDRTWNTGDQLKSHPMSPPNFEFDQLISIASTIFHQKRSVPAAPGLKLRCWVVHWTSTRHLEEWGPSIDGVRWRRAPAPSCTGGMAWRDVVLTCFKYIQIP